MAAAEPAPAPAKAAPALGSLFPTKKKNFKGTNLSSAGGQKEVKKKSAGGGTDEWGEEEVTNEKLRVAVQVEELNTNENDVVEDKPTWKPKESKGDDADEKTTKQYPSLARSVKPGAGASSAGPAAPAKVEGISGKASKFDALNDHEEEEEEEDKNDNAADGEAAAKKAAKKEAKRLEKERREKEAAQAAAKRDKKERVVMVDGVPDTKIRPDMDAIQAKYDGRRKRPVVEIDED